MKITCYTSDTKRDARLVVALAAGFRFHGCEVTVAGSKDESLAPPGDLAVFVGVRHSSARVRDMARAAGVRTLMLDKGYFQRSKYHRFSLDTAQPTYLTRMGYEYDRLRSLGLPPNPHRAAHLARDVLYVESTQKYYDFHNLGPVDLYSHDVCMKLTDVVRDMAGLRVVHRPREHPGPLYAAPPGTRTSDPVAVPFRLALTTAHCVVVHGSNAGVEAMAAGVPVLSLGDCTNNAVHDLVNHSFWEVKLPKVPPESAVTARLAQLAWCQFSIDEIASGFAWDHVKRWM